MIVVGNLLDDPKANSFISLEDAESFLIAEQNDDWAVAERESKEAALISASRWMAASLPWCENRLTEGDLTRVGYAAARLANATLTGGLWGAEDVRGNLIEEHYKAGSVELREKYDGRNRNAASSGGNAFPWLNGMLKGLLCGGRNLFADIVRR